MLLIMVYEQLSLILDLNRQPNDYLFRKILERKMQIVQSCATYDDLKVFDYLIRKRILTIPDIIKRSKMYKFPNDIHELVDMYASDKLEKIFKTIKSENIVRSFVRSYVVRPYKLQQLD